MQEPYTLTASETVTFGAQNYENSSSAPLRLIASSGIERVSYKVSSSSTTPRKEPHEMIGGYLREVAALVLVFVPLDQYITVGQLSATWVVGTLCKPGPPHFRNSLGESTGVTSRSQD